VADGEAEPLRQASPGAPAKGEANLAEVGLMPDGAACVGLSQLREAFGEDTARAGYVRAEEVAHLQDERDLPPAHRPVAHGALVTALDALGATRRTPDNARQCCGLPPAQ